MANRRAAVASRAMGGSPAKRLMRPMSEKKPKRSG
jgi:hypothetical protein